MRLCQALTQAMFALQMESDRKLLEYHPISRKILTISGIINFWVRQVWTYKYDVKCTLYDIINTDPYTVFIDTIRAIISEVEKMVSDNSINLSSEHSQVIKNLLFSLRNCLDVIDMIYNGKQFNTYFICCNCGQYYKEHGENCAVCCGSGNQIIRVWEL